MGYRDGPTGLPRKPMFPKSVEGALAAALWSLERRFPAEWAGLSDAARTDDDFVGACLEACDKIDLGIANLRALIRS